MEKRKKRTAAKVTKKLVKTPLSKKKTKPAPLARRRAATAEILPALPSLEVVPRKWRTQFKRLLELRSHLQQSKADLVRDAREEQPAFSLHMADAATDHFDRDFALSMISSEQNSLYEIEQALNRIRNGTYGICELTGKPIEAERLAAIPWTRFSLEGERLFEEKQGNLQTRLGDRERIPKGPTAGELSEEEESD